MAANGEFLGLLPHGGQKVFFREGKLFSVMRTLALGAQLCFSMKRLDSLIQHQEAGFPPPVGDAAFVSSRNAPCSCLLPALLLQDSGPQGLWKGLLLVGTSLGCS